jgi:hypothetical protein
MDMNTKLGLGHSGPGDAAWAWTHSMGIDKQHDMDKAMDMDY